MTFALILAGGSGQRMSALGSEPGGAPPGLPKQFLPVAVRAMLLRAIDCFEAHPEIDRITVVCAPQWSGRLKYMLEQEHYRKLSPLHPVVDGGSDRRESSRRGIDALMQEGAPDDIVLIHDAARPLVPAHVISDCIACTRLHDACAAAIPVTDTIYLSPNGETVDAIPDRRTLYAAQTPQAFRLLLIHDAHHAWDGTSPVTDDAGLLLAQGIPVWLAQGDERNIKLTFPSDLSAAERLF